MSGPSRRRSRAIEPEPGALIFFLSLLIEGALAGALYLLLMAMLMVRPYGLFGRPPAVQI